MYIYHALHTPELLGVIFLPPQQHIHNAPLQAPQTPIHGRAELDGHRVVNAVLEKLGIMLADCKCTHVLVNVVHIRVCAKSMPALMQAACVHADCKHAHVSLSSVYMCTAISECSPYSCTC